MGLVGGPVNFPRLALLVVRVELLDLYGRDDPAGAVHERGLVAFGDAVRLFPVYGERNREAPYETVCETHVLDDAVVVLAHHETGQRRKNACGDCFEIGERPPSERDFW